MDAEAWAAEGFTPAGTDTYGRFMRIRIFDTWLHEQDIRDAMDRPGHESGLPVELTLDEMSRARWATRSASSAGRRPVRR